jgi:hypothetical protein
MSKIERARALRRVIEQLAGTLTDEAAAESAELFPQWDPDGHDYAAGDRVRDDGVLYKVLQAHTSQPGWAPADAPSLFAEVLPGQDGTEIGVWKKPDSTNPYMTGNRVHYPTMADPIYESLIDNNVWSPEEYPAGWREI